MTSKGLYYSAGPMWWKCADMTDVCMTPSEGKVGGNGDDLTLAEIDNVKKGKTLHWFYGGLIKTQFLSSMREVCGNVLTVDDLLGMNVSWLVSGWTTLRVRIWETGDLKIGDSGDLLISVLARLSKREKGCFVGDGTVGGHCLTVQPCEDVPSSVLGVSFVIPTNYKEGNSEQEFSDSSEGDSKDMSGFEVEVNDSAFKLRPEAQMSGVYRGLVKPEHLQHWYVAYGDGITVKDLLTVRLDHLNEGWMSLKVLQTLGGNLVFQAEGDLLLDVLVSSVGRYGYASDKADLGSFCKYVEPIKTLTILCPHPDSYLMPWDKESMGDGFCFYKALNMNYPCALEKFPTFRELMAADLHPIAECALKELRFVVFDDVFLHLYDLNECANWRQQSFVQLVLYYWQAHKHFLGTDTLAYRIVDSMRGESCQTLLEIVGCSDLGNLRVGYEGIAVESLVMNLYPGYMSNGLLDDYVRVIVAGQSQLLSVSGKGYVRGVLECLEDDVIDETGAVSLVGRMSPLFPEQAYSYVASAGTYEKEENAMVLIPEGVGVLFLGLVVPGPLYLAVEVGTAFTLVSHVGFVICHKMYYAYFSGELLEADFKSIHAVFRGSLDCNAYPIQSNEHDL